MNRIHDMTFKEFAEAVKPSAGMNRWPQIGPGQEVMSYSVYMNGELAEMLPSSVREHEYRDVMLHALTDKLGLNSHSIRDNLKVAELVAVRHAYMTAVLEASMAFTLSEAVMKDYEALSNQMSHPLIREAIEEQQLLSNLLTPVLEDAERALGKPVHEKDAAGVVRGEVITANSKFTVQSLGDGEIVVHENDRLQGQMPIGADVTVVYYRGQGQILDHVMNHDLSVPYIDRESGDLAVNLLDSQNNIKQVIKFGSMALVAQFANEHGLDRSFVEQAMDARTTTPKVEVPRVQTIESEPYIDTNTDALAFDFREGPVKYTAVFKSAEDLASRAKQLGASEAFIGQAYLAERLHGTTVDIAAEKRSLSEANAVAQKHAGIEGEVKPANVLNGRYAGKVLHTTALHVVQDNGRNEVIVHDKRDLDKVPLAGERMSVAYSNGRAETKMREVSQSRNTGR